MRNFKHLLTAVLWAFVGHAMAQQMSGRELREGLDADERVVSGRATPALLGSASVAMGYVRGVSDAMSVLSGCIPANASPGQNMAIVQKYLKNNPEKWHLPAITLVATALNEAFECKGQNQ